MTGKLNRLSRSLFQTMNVVMEQKLFSNDRGWVLKLDASTNRKEMKSSFLRSTSMPQQIVRRLLRYLQSHRKNFMVSIFVGREVEKPLSTSPE